ncbi:hypothetical protein RFI_10491, partial [Reticulomyxa filosa]
MKSADSYFTPFRLGCETYHHTVVEVSLDAIQKLVAGEYLTGSTVLSTANGKPRRLIDNIVETKTLKTKTKKMHAYKHRMKDDQVTCYIVYLNTKNFDVQTSGIVFWFGDLMEYNRYVHTCYNVCTCVAIATLTQTLAVLFERIETTASQLKKVQSSEKLMSNSSKTKQVHDLQSKSKSESESKSRLQGKSRSSLSAAWKEMTLKRDNENKEKKEMESEESSQGVIEIKGHFANANHGHAESILGTVKDILDEMIDNITNRFEKGKTNESESEQEFNDNAKEMMEMASAKSIHDVHA